MDKLDNLEKNQETPKPKDVSVALPDEKKSEETNSPSILSPTVYNLDLDEASKRVRLQELQDKELKKKNEQVNLANQKIQSSYFAIESMKNPSNFKPINLGPAINTEAPEYFPTITVDGKTILFTRRIKDTRVSGPVKEQEDFYISHLKGNAWSKAEPMPSHINTVNNEGAPTIAADGRSLIFIACPDPAGEYGAGRLGRGSCDMFVTKRIGSSWGQVLNLPGLPNSQNWETQPSLSADGKTLYFIRGVRLPNGTRSSDI